MAWIELHQGLVHHPKLYAVADDLKVDRMQALGHLAALWLWALDNAESGDLRPFPDDTLALAGQWRRKPSQFVDALRSRGFIDAPGVLHDWTDYAGKLIERRIKDKERKRNSRGQSVGHPQERRRKSARNRTVPNQKAAAAARDPATAAVFRALEDLLGSLSKTIADLVGAELDEGVPADWIVAACAEAAKHNARSWAYVEKIIRRWQRDGFQASSKQGSKEQAEQERIDAEFAEAAKRAGM